MKHIFYTALVVLLVLQSCTTKFDLTSTWKDIAVVYGLLDKNADTTFIKINKAYLDPKTSALTLAQVADSLYYTNLTAELLEYDSTNTFVQNIPLVKADGNLEGHVKASGTFAGSPNYLYQTTEKIHQSSTYHLILINNDNGQKDTSFTNVVNGFNTAIPPTANFFPGYNFNVGWTSAVNGAIYGLIAHFHYHEINISTGQRANDSILWTLFTSFSPSSTSGGESEQWSIPGSSFYNFVNSQLKDNPAVHRVADNLTFTFSVAGEAYYNFTQVEQAQLGITSGQTQPIYTNIYNGVGLFSSRTFEETPPIGFNARTIDSIACGAETGHLGFLNSLGAPCQ